MDEQMNQGPSGSVLFDDCDFQHLVCEFMRRCMPWDEFLKQPMPRGVSPLQAWELMNKLGKASGIRSPVTDLDRNEYWFRRTYEIDDGVARIVRDCCADSALYATISAASNQRFVIQARIQEMVAASQLDGLDISEGDARFLLSHGRTPRTAAERFVVNTFRAADKLPELVGEPFSPELFRYLRDLLLERVAVDELKFVDEAPLGIALFDWPDERVEKCSDDQMALISEWLNEDRPDVYDPPALKPIGINEDFRFYRPLGKTSSQVGRLVSSLYALKHDLPVLALLPVSKAKLEWSAGTIPPPRVAYTRGQFEQLRRMCPGDVTCMVTLGLQLTLIALEEIKADVETWKRRDREMQDILSDEESLNPRQREIVGKALRNPEELFSISYHLSHHDITYPTARRDFMALVERGYLECLDDERAYRFRAAKGLRGKLGLGEQ